MGPPQILWGHRPIGVIKFPLWDPSRPKIEKRKRCISFSSIFNVDRPFQRYQTKTWDGWVKITPLENAKSAFFQKAHRF